MAPSITPSPHRFLPGSSARQAKPSEQQSTTGTGGSPRANLSKSFNTRSTQNPGPSLSRAAPRFVSKPRFTGPGSPASETRHHSSPKPKKDHVEEFDHPPSAVVQEDAVYSPSRGSVKQHRGRELIDESTDDDDEGDPPAEIVTYDDEDYDLAPLARKRKISSRSPWTTSAPDEQHVHKKNYQMSPQNHASRSSIPLAQANQDVPADVTYPPRQMDAQRHIASPRPSSLVPPFSEGHTRPRFDFAKLTERSSSKLQKIIGTGHFILDSAAPPAESQREPLSSENTNLTLLFSPQKHKKYQYAPGGLASTVRDWVLDAAVGVNGANTLSTIQVISVEAGERGSRLVCGVNKMQEKERFLLLGESRGPRNAVVAKGCYIVIMEPSWMFESDGVLTVAMNWKVVGAG